MSYLFAIACVVILVMAITMIALVKTLHDQSDLIVQLDASRHSLHDALRNRGVDPSPYDLHVLQPSPLHAWRTE